MKTQEAVDKTNSFVLKTYGRFPVAFERGEGAILYNLEGEAYLDFASGLGVNALGNGDPRVAELIQNQADRVIHTSNLYNIPSQAVLAEKLCNVSFGERVFFCNSGTESVEAALKFARKWGSHLDEPKYKIVGFTNSFHGRTFGSLSATFQEKYRTGFEPLVPGFIEVPFNDLNALKKVLTSDVAAVIIEPLQGEGGVNFASTDFMKSLETLCRERDVLLIVDEVQCGMARTGKLFAHEHFGITPDIMTLAKPLAGGLPIGATVVGERVWPHINPGEHASTFGGNHFVTSVACGVFDIISDDAFVSDVAQKGEYILSKLHGLAEKHTEIKELRGKGLLVGAAVDFPAAEYVNYALERKILVCSAGPNVVRFIPPLVVTTEHIDRVIDTFAAFLDGRA